MTAKVRFPHSLTRTLARSAIGGLALLIATEASGEERSGEQSLFIVEAGAAGERDLSGGGAHFGSAVGLEIEPLEDRLEIEIGASRFRKVGDTVWDLDMAFKTPWRLSPTIEVMPGIGPTWEQNTRSGLANTWGAQAVLDLFVWHSRRVGWFVEPAFALAFDAERSKFFGITAGLFVAVR